MMSPAKFAVACVLALALLGCSRPADLTVRKASVGPLTIDTAYETAAVARLLPGFTVEAAVSSELQPGEHVIRVSDGATPLFEVYPSADRKTVESVLVLNDRIRDEKGIHIGSSFAAALPEGNLGDCMAGAGEKSGRLYCPQPGSSHIIYELQGTPPAPDGQVPPAEALKGWHVTSMLWVGRDPVPAPVPAP
jgi:hypothetical protein